MRMSKPSFVEKERERNAQIHETRAVQARRRLSGTHYMFAYICGGLFSKGILN